MERTWPAAGGLSLEGIKISESESKKQIKPSVNSLGAVNLNQTTKLNGDESATNVKKHVQVKEVHSNPVHSNPVRSNPMHSNPVRSNPMHSNPVKSEKMNGQNLANAAPVLTNRRNDQPTTIRPPLQTQHSEPTRSTLKCLPHPKPIIKIEAKNELKNELIKSELMKSEPRTEERTEIRNGWKNGLKTDLRIDSIAIESVKADPKAVSSPVDSIISIHEESADDESTEDEQSEEEIIFHGNEGDHESAGGLTRRLPRNRSRSVEEEEEEEAEMDFYYPSAYKSVSEYKESLNELCNKNKRIDFFQRLGNREDRRDRGPQAQPIRLRSDRSGLIQVFIVLIIAVIAMKFLVGVEKRNLKPALGDASK